MGLVAASEGEPVCGGAGQGGPGQQASDLGDVHGDHAASAGGGCPGRTGAGAWVSVRFLSWAAVTALMARAAMTRTMCRAIAV